LPVKVTAVCAIILIAAGSASADPVIFNQELNRSDASYLRKTLKLGTDMDSEPMPDRSSPVAVARPDLNGDEKPDYIIMFRAPAWGGNRGQRIDVFVSQGEQYVPALRALAVTVELGGMTSGVRDIIINGNVISWNGRGYGPR
jgi:hypothetical protein